MTPLEEGYGEARQAELPEGHGLHLVDAVVDLDDAAEDLLRDDREGVEGGELDLVGRRTVGTVLDRDDQIALFDAKGALRLRVKRSDHCT